MSTYYALVQEFMDQNPPNYRHPGFTQRRIHLAHIYAAYRVGWVTKKEIREQVCLMNSLIERGLI